MTFDLNLRGSSQDIHNHPTLGATEGTSLPDSNAIADPAPIFFIVNLESLRPGNNFFVLIMGNPIFHGDDHRLLHFVTDNKANPFFNCHVHLLPLLQLDFEQLPDQLLGAPAQWSLFELAGAESA